MGVNVPELLERAVEMAHSCADSVPADENPGVWLGAVLGQLAAGGRNKLTLIASPKIATFGYWVEQLIAESTGKQGKGIVPIEGEPLGKPAVYGDDRLFVYIRMESDPVNRAVKALEKAGHPVVTLTLRDKLDLGGEFFRWEVATAIAGSILGIDPFDQPNVQESKDNTQEGAGRVQSQRQAAEGGVDSRGEVTGRASRPCSERRSPALTSRSWPPPPRARPRRRRRSPRFEPP